MKVLFVAIISMTLLFSTFTLTESFAAKPSQSDGVYLINSNDQGLKNMFGVRHNFDVGFTTFLNDRQAAALERAGLELEQVPKYELAAPPGACTPWPSCKDGGDDGGDSGSDSRTATPSTQIPWGIDTIYKNSGVTPSGGSGVTVAVLDTGVNRDHLDLSQRVVDCKDFTKGPNAKNTCKDDNGHGTHVAGTILADGGSDGLGIYGVAPEASLMALKVCAATCWTDDIAAAINYAGANGANIVSMSLGGDSQSTLITNAIAANPNILYVAAAGNDGPAIGSIDYPGANVNTVAVAAVDSTISVASFSSRGINDGDGIIEEREVELAAPGVSIESTWNNGAYNTISGTSMATPHVSGLAAKVWTGDAAGTRTLLQSLAVDIDAVGDDPASGFGLPQSP